MKLAHNLFEQLNIFEQQVIRLEEKIAQLEDQLNDNFKDVRNKLVRVKNKQDLPDDFILSARKYLDLSPQKASQLYYSNDFDFMLIDVSHSDFSPPLNFPEAIRIPWEHFPQRYLEIQSKATPLLIISEDGVNSVLACNFLIKKGFYNTNNISGGYKFWIEKEASLT